MNPATTVPSTISPAIAETGARDESSPGPFWPRLARAVALLTVAVSLHVWAIGSPNPQPTAFGVLASRMISQLLTPPSVPLSPPLSMAGVPGTSAVSGRPLSLNTAVPQIPPAPIVAAYPQPLRRLPVPVGTTGTTDSRAVNPLRASGPDDSIPPAAMQLSAVANSAGNAHADPVEVATELRHSPLEAPPPPVARAMPVSPPGPDLAELKRTAADDEQRQKDVVLAVLHEYNRAFERLDARATKAIYPSVDERQLQRRFRDLAAQQVRFASCDLSISSSGNGANARCKGEASYRPKVGAGVMLKNREWTFDLSRDGGEWQILNARVQ